MKTIDIDVACPAYRGASYPSFDEKSINESRFDDDLRAKEWDILIKDNEGYINWLTQIGEDPTTLWEDEVIRAFKANGLNDGSKIHVKFGSRDTGYIHKYDITV